MNMKVRMALEEGGRYVWRVMGKWIEENEDDREGEWKVMEGRGEGWKSKKVWKGEGKGVEYGGVGDACGKGARIGGLIRGEVADDGSGEW